MKITKDYHCLSCNLTYSIPSLAPLLNPGDKPIGIIDCISCGEPLRDLDGILRDLVRDHIHNGIK